MAPHIAEKADARYRDDEAKFVKSVVTAVLVRIDKHHKRSTIGYVLMALLGFISLHQIVREEISLSFLTLPADKEEAERVLSIIRDDILIPTIRFCHETEPRTVVSPFQANIILLCVFERLVEKELQPLVVSDRIKEKPWRVKQELSPQEWVRQEYVRA